LINPEGGALGSRGIFGLKAAEILAATQTRTAWCAAAMADNCARCSHEVRVRIRSRCGRMITQALPAAENEEHDNGDGQVEEEAR